MPDDERLNRDGSLTPAWRERVRTARALLLDSLALFDARRPGDAWITGARVRFLVDQGDVAGAKAVAGSCAANRVWCAQLTGFALDAAGEYAHADSAFDAAAAAMDPKTRCEWIDIRELLDADSRSTYEHLNCDERMRANETVWWLATPLFSDSASDRRSQQFARKVLIQMHSALPWDERFDWRGIYGGRAVSEMLLRYGWPAHSVFAGANEQDSHANWMTFYDSTRTATVEYPQNRLHLLPDWQAVASPFSARADAWQINMPSSTNIDDPAELEQLHDRLQGAADGSIFVRTTGPRVVQRVPHQTFRNDAAIVLVAHVPAEPAIIGTELPASRPGEPSARTRLGVMPPSPLSALIPGETAVSDPVFLSADGGLPSSPDQALSTMLGSTRVRDKVGLYWETYGVAPGDSVEIAVVITRTESLSKLRRIGMFLRVAHVSRLEPGHYNLQVRVGRNGALSATAGRDFVLERR